MQTTQYPKTKEFIHELSELIRLAEISKDHEEIIESLPFPYYVIDVETYKITVSNRKIADDAKCHLVLHGLEYPCSGTDHQCPIHTIRAGEEFGSEQHVHKSEKNGRLELVPIEVRAYPIKE